MTPEEIIRRNKDIHKTALWLATNDADSIQLEADARSYDELSQNLLKISKEYAKMAKNSRKEAQEATNFETLQYMVDKDNE